MTSQASYILVQSTYFLQNSLHVGYGVAVVIEDGSDVTVVKTVPNISSDRIAMARFVERCNARHLSPLHLQDVIEDFIG